MRHALQAQEPRPPGDFVIAGDADDKLRADLKRPWDLIIAFVKLEGVRIHIRHTHASVGAGVSLDLPIIGKLLDYRQPETTVRYAQSIPLLCEKHQITFVGTNAAERRRRA
jgi:hypothetical protein